MNVLNAAHAVISKVLSSANASLDVPAIRRRYGATKERITELRVGNRYRTWLTLTDRGVVFVPQPRFTNENGGSKAWHGDGLFEIRDLVVALDLVRGKRLTRNPQTGKEVWNSYTPQDAYWFGAIRVYGDKSSNEAIRFILQVWPEIRDRLRRDLRISGGA